MISSSCEGVMFRGMHSRRICTSSLVMEYSMQMERNGAGNVKQPALNSPPRYFVISAVVFKEYTLNLAEILDNAATAHQAVDMQVAGLKFQNLMRAEMPEVVQECLKVVGIIVKSIFF
jgi:hypothetical protein